MFGQSIPESFLGGMTAMRTSLRLCAEMPMSDCFAKKVTFCIAFFQLSFRNCGRTAMILFSEDYRNFGSLNENRFRNINESADVSLYLIKVANSDLHAVDKINADLQLIC